jgi:hypothetical protein
MWLPGTVIRYVPSTKQFVVRYDWLEEQGDEDPDILETLSGARAEKWREIEE